MKLQYLVNIELHKREISLAGDINKNRTRNKSYSTQKSNKASLWGRKEFKVEVNLCKCYCKPPSSAEYCSEPHCLSHNISTNYLREINH